MIFISIIHFEQKNHFYIPEMIKEIMISGEYRNGSLKDMDTTKFPARNITMLIEL